MEDNNTPIYEAPPAQANEMRDPPARDKNVVLGEKLFKLRDYTPIPLIAVLLFLAESSVVSATIGMLLVLFGEIIRIYSVGYIGSISRTRKSSTGAKLITSGPFGLVRNPLYVGNFFITMGIAVYGGVAWIVILAVGAFAFQYFYVVKYEENLLLQRFGEDYQHYLDTVPAWIPMRMPPLAEWAPPMDVDKALRSEKRTLGAILLMIFALMLRASS